MKIVLLEPLGVAKEDVKNLAATFEALGHEFVMYDNKTVVKEEIIERTKDAEVLILANQAFPDEYINECPKLKYISVAFTGVDHMGIKACTERGINVSNAAGYSNHGVAELAIGFMISTLRNIIPCDIAVRGGKTKDGLVGNDLFEKTVGVIGTGAIGMLVAKLLTAFGCKVIAYDTSKREEEARSIGMKYVDLDTLLKESDIVTIHVPLFESTKGLIGKREISLMKKSSILINTARGPIVDSLALAEALKEGRIAAAGIDVYETEPPIDVNHPLLNAPHVVATPHVAFATKEALYRRAIIAFDNIKQWMAGEQINKII
ncbi:MAG TPA: NAD(P)-dependent oxidoreductase [Clostridiaceae bacterium]